MNLGNQIDDNKQSQLRYQLRTELSITMSRRFSDTERRFIWQRFIRITKRKIQFIWNRKPLTQKWMEE